MHWLIWVIGGLAVALAELVVPGLIALFLGAGAVITGVLVLAGFLQDLGSQLLAWLFFSFVLFFLFRDRITKYFPALESKDARTEDQVMAGKIVEVIEDITPQRPGRVHVHDTSWQAVSKLPVNAGSKVKILSREGLILTVEPADKS